MDIRLHREARRELADAVRSRYQSASSMEKRRMILDEFIATTGYHEKSAIRVLNAPAVHKQPQKRSRVPLYDEAVRAALIVLWEASDRVCAKRLQPLLRILLPALERNGHLKLQDPIRSKLLAMSAATVDRLLRVPRSTSRSKKPRRLEPAPRRRVRMRTFADWNEPLPGCMEMDLVAHCGTVNRGSYVHSLVLTDIASGWTEWAPLVVREGGLVVETIERIRLGLPESLISNPGMAAASGRRFTARCPGRSRQRSESGGACSAAAADVLTLSEATQLLRVTPEELEQLASRGEVPARRIGSSWRFKREVQTGGASPGSPGSMPDEQGPGIAL